jgi:hypothetical protein
MMELREANAAREVLMRPGNGLDRLAQLARKAPGEWIAYWRQIRKPASIQAWAADHPEFDVQILTDTASGLTWRRCLVRYNHETDTANHQLQITRQDANNLMASRHTVEWTSGEQAG